MKRLTCIVFALILLFACAFSVSAETIEEDLVYLNEQKSVVFWVSWTADEPTVTFIAPDGTVYDPKAVAENTTTIGNATDMYYTVLDAPAGQWKVRLDKKNNDEVEISVHDYDGGIHIDYFDIGAVADNSIPVSFCVSGKENQSYSFKISAMIDHTGAEKELYSGSSRTGIEENHSLRLDSLSTYDSYILKLYIWYDNNGADVSDFCFSDAFSYTNADLDAKAPGYALTVEPENALLIIEWEDLGYGAEGVLVSVFEDNAEDPVVFDEYNVDSSPVQLSYDPACTEVSVEVAVKYDGKNAAPLRKTAKLSDMAISIPDGQLFNYLKLPMSYKGLNGQATDIWINDKSSPQVLTGSGTLSLNLQDDWNNVKITYTDTNNITWRIERDIFIDRQPPILNLDRPYDGMTVNEKEITISGTVTDCSALTVNGTAVTVSTSGAFSHKIALASGANEIIVSATDKAGNECRYTASVNCGSVAVGSVSDSDGSPSPDSWFNRLFGSGSYLVLIIVSVICVLIALYALIFWKKQGAPKSEKAPKEKKKKEKKSKKETDGPSSESEGIGE